MRIFRAAAPVAALAVLAAPLAGPASADDDARGIERTISVRGEGEAVAKPDQAQVSLAVVTQAKTAAAALSENSERMTKVLGLLSRSGIAARDVATRAIELSPVYQPISPQLRSSDPAKPPEIVGYRAVNRIAVKLRDLARLGALLDDVVGEGANRLDGISLQIGEQTALADQARGRAIADARRKAALYARAAGAELGPVLTIAEHDVQPHPPQRLRAFRAQESSGVPIAAGEQTIRASVSVTYRIR